MIHSSLCGRVLINLRKAAAQLNHDASHTTGEQTTLVFMHRCEQTFTGTGRGIASERQNDYESA